MWTMSPGAFPPDVWVYVWHINLNGYLSCGPINRPRADFQPVINLNANVSATGTGTSSDPYVVLTN